MLVVMKDEMKVSILVAMKVVNLDEMMVLQLDLGS